MAVGQVKAIPSGTGVYFHSPSGFTAPTISVLNPNDGIVYIARNRSADTTSIGGWDWKVPSQSYASLPGPFDSIGAYYLDQSGSNQAGEVTVYSVAQKTQLPMFQAIGRAVQTAGSTLDVSTGSQPANPPLATVRLWADGSGDLHTLSGSGVDDTLLDTGNYNAKITMAGDVVGPLSATRIHVSSGVALWDFNDEVRWNDANHRIVVSNSNVMYFDEYGTFTWRCSSRAYASTMTLDANGNLQTAQSIASGNASGLWLNAAAGDIAANNHLIARYDVYANRNIIATGNVSVNGNTLAFADSGSYFVASSAYVYLRANNGFNVQNLSGGYGPPINCGPITSTTGQFTVDQSNGGYGYCFRDTNVMLRRPVSLNYLELRSYDRRLDIMDNSGTVSVYSIQGTSGQVDHYGYNGSTNHRFFHFDTTWMGTQAANFQVQSDALSKTDIQPMSDIECLSRIRQDLPVVTWQPDWQNNRLMGFTAQDMQKVVPEVVAYHTGDVVTAEGATLNSTGDVFGIQYDNLTALIWAAVRNIDQRLQKLEGAAAA